MEKYQCQVCETIITSEQVPTKCSCGSRNLEEYFMPKKELFAKFKDDLLKKEEDNPLHRSFLVEEIEEEEEVKKVLLRAFEDIQFIINRYLDMDKKLVKIIALWIIGTYFHKNFNTYPYLYLNAMRGSGKTRLLKLIAAMSWKGDVQNSMTEAVLFRTQGTLCIDEFERAGKRGSENLLELLNSAYKKGTTVKRMKKKKTPDGEEQVVESYLVYRPISIANITGIDNVLGDRCIKIIIEKSINEKKTRLLENVLESRISSIKENLKSISSIRCSLCNEVTPQNLLVEWNKYILEEEYTPIYTHTLPTLHTLTTLKQRFHSIKETTINGRDLELSFPLLIISMWIDGAMGLEGIFDESLDILHDISKNKKEEESIENLDISLYDYISQEIEVYYFISIQKITEGFRQFVQTNDEWLNNKWVGRALSRLKLTTDKRRLRRGIEVRLDYNKAKEKIKMFK
ncbi:hypothetical protein LCGC14_0571410 [marine sediment metagenome]|uniref:DUF3631 domain-containing protein n=1 Tax=marine sediment metagenome TaxID=412755 RepID=A0A0F9USF0_9ZZZZ